MDQDERRKNKGKKLKCGRKSRVKDNKKIIISWSNTENLRINK